MSLISVMVAMVLVAMVAAVFASSFQVALNSCKIVGNTSQALSIAQHKIDQMRAVGYGRLNYSDLQSAGIIDANPSTQPYSFQGVESLNTYYPAPTGTITITQPEADVAMVTVYVSWSGNQKVQGNITLKALIVRD